MITDENVQSRVKRHKVRQVAGRPKKETVLVERPKKETVLTVEPSVNSDGNVSKVCTIKKYNNQSLEIITRQNYQTAILSLHLVRHPIHFIRELK